MDLADVRRPALQDLQHVRFLLSHEGRHRPLDGPLSPGSNGVVTDRHMLRAVAARGRGVEHLFGPLQAQRGLLGGSLRVLSKLGHGLLHAVDNLLAGDGGSTVLSIPRLLCLPAQDSLDVASLLGHGVSIHLFQEGLRKLSCRPSTGHPSLFVEILLLVGRLHRVLRCSIGGGLLRADRGRAAVNCLLRLLHGLHSGRVGSLRSWIGFVSWFCFAGVFLLRVLRLRLFVSTSPTTSLHSLHGKCRGRRLHSD
mmetsp:Transcript_30373/g.78477  ORF Transcript_30373/g.78477 Transcript_30373/m.78477 type:complete len:252 (+) Transcript_30373:917-1672(+)